MCKHNSLPTKAPVIAAQWHPTRNVSRKILLHLVVENLTGYAQLASIHGLPSLADVSLAMAAPYAIFSQACASGGDSQPLQRASIPCWLSEIINGTLRPGTSLIRSLWGAGSRFSGCAQLVQQVKSTATQPCPMRRLGAIVHQAARSVQVANLASAIC